MSYCRHIYLITSALITKVCITVDNRSLKDISKPEKFSRPISHWTARELADELDVNFNTVARAYRMLDETGSISTQQGRGTFVTEPGEVGGVTLEEISRRFAAQAHRLGFQPEEVAQAIGYVLGQWEQEGNPPDA